MGTRWNFQQKNGEVMTVSVNIDYNRKTEKYNEIIVSHGTEILARWGSGDPQSDWETYVEWAAERDLNIAEGDSVTQFLLDVPGWRMIVGKLGKDVIVPEDRPEWANHALENRCVRVLQMVPKSFVVFEKDGITWTAAQMILEIETGSDIAKQYIASPL